MAPARHLVTVDQHDIEIGQAARRARDAGVARRDHEDENVEIALHHRGEPPRGDIAEIALGHEALAGLGGVLETRGLGEPQRAPLQRRLLADLRAEPAEGSDELTSYALIGAENLGRNVGSPPVETTFANQPERIGEIVERRAELLDNKEQFVGREPALARLDRRNGLAVVEAEQVCKVFLRKAFFLPKGFQTLSYESVRHQSFSRKQDSLADVGKQDYLAIRRLTPGANADRKVETNQQWHIMPLLVQGLEWPGEYANADQKCRADETPGRTH